MLGPKRRLFHRSGLKTAAALFVIVIAAAGLTVYAVRWGTDAATDTNEPGSPAPMPAQGHNSEGPSSAAAAGPVLVYVTASYYCSSAGFPNLLIYEDGTTLSSGPQKCQPPGPNGPPDSARLYRLPRERVREILDRVEATGILGVPPVSGELGQYHEDALYIELSLGGKKASFFSYAESSPVRQASQYLDSIIANLRKGVEYSPPGYLAEFIPATEANRPGNIPDARPWQLAPKVSLAILSQAGVGQNYLVLPPPFLRDLQRIGRAYWWLPVEEGGQHYLVRWRPLLPHE